MIQQTRHILETDVNATCIARIESFGVQMRRAEVPILHPSHGQVYPDAVGMKAEADGDSFVIFEGERNLSAQLVSEILRWQGWARYLVVGFIPSKRQNATYEHNRLRLHHAGVTMIQVIGESTVMSELHPLEVDQDKSEILAAAYYAHSGAHDAPSGIASASRMTSERCELAALGEWLELNPYSTINQIHDELPEWRTVSPHQLRRRFDASRAQKPDLGLRYRGKSITEFYREVK